MAHTLYDDCYPLPAIETKPRCLMNEMLGFKFLGKNVQLEKIKNPGNKLEVHISFQIPM